MSVLPVPDGLAAWLGEEFPHDDRAWFLGWSAAFAAATLSLRAVVIPAVLRPLAEARVPSQRDLGPEVSEAPPTPPKGLRRRPRAGAGGGAPAPALAPEAAKRKAADLRAKSVEKFIGSSWGLVGYTFILAAGAICVFDAHTHEGWVRELGTEAFWLHYFTPACRVPGSNPTPPCPGLTFSGRLHLLYVVLNGFFMAEIFVLAAEKRAGRAKSDFPVMMAHHFVSILLLGISYEFGFMRIGAVVVLLHTQDALLEAAKLARYQHMWRAAEVLFGLFFLTWVVMRCYVYPVYVVRSCGRHTFDLAVSLLRESGAVTSAEGERPWYAVYYLANFFLNALLAMDVYWSWQIGRVVHTAATQGSTQAGDHREEDP